MTTPTETSREDWEKELDEIIGKYVARFIVATVEKRDPAPGEPISQIHDFIRTNFIPRSAVEEVIEDCTREMIDMQGGIRKHVIFPNELRTKLSLLDTKNI